MSREVILKKLEQIKILLEELGLLLGKPFEDFKHDVIALRASERSFQLMVDLATDINTQILIEAGEEVPDTYKQSFLGLPKLDILGEDLALQLSKSAMLRNILVHEYDFEEDYMKFYQSAQAFIPIYRQYLEKVYNFASRMENEQA